MQKTRINEGEKNPKIRGTDPFNDKKRAKQTEFLTLAYSIANKPVQYIWKRFFSAFSHAFYAWRKNGQTEMKNPRQLNYLQ